MDFQIKVESPDGFVTNPYPGLPDSKTPTMAIVGTPSARKLGRVVSRSSSEAITELEEKIVLIKREAELEGLQAKLGEANGKVLELETASTAVSAELEPLKKQLTEMQVVCEPLELELIDAENKLYQLRARAASTKTSDDHKNAYKQEIEVAKLKPEVFENMIQKLVIEENISNTAKRSDEIKKALHDAIHAAVNNDSELEQLKTVVDKERTDFKERWGYDTAEISEDFEAAMIKEIKAGQVVEVLELDCRDDPTTPGLLDVKTSSLSTNVQNQFRQMSSSNQEEVEDLKMQLEKSKQEVLRQAEEIALFKKPKPEDGIENDNNSIVSNTVQTRNGDKVPSSVADLLKENQALRDRVTHMEPLWYVGYYTRARKFEYEKPGRPDSHIINRGNEAFKGANVCADATMFLGWAPEMRTSLSDFQNLYKITPSIAWEYRMFTSFQKIIGWNHEMATRYRNRDAAVFNENFDKLFKAIYPSFKINNDALIQSDPELRTAFDIMRKEIESAYRAERAGPVRAIRPANGAILVKPSEATNS